MDAVNIQSIPSEIIINHIIDNDIFLPLMFTCQMFYKIVGRYIESGRVFEKKHKHIVTNRLVESVQIGNTRAIRLLLKVPHMALYRREWMTITSLFKDYCGLAYINVKYHRALQLVHNQYVNIDRCIDTTLIWCAKLSRGALFDAIIARGPGIKAIKRYFTSIISDLITIGDEYYVGKFLDYVFTLTDLSINELRYINNIHWYSAHPNLRALKTTLEKLKPCIEINDCICPQSHKRDSKTDDVMKLIWPYCDDRKVDIDNVIRHTIRALDHEYLGFITRKLATREIVPKYDTRINPMLIKLMQSMGRVDIHDVLTDLSRIMC
ncbi:hypothetical protein F-LCD7_0348 [Faustovirus]|nr:hypothetical protein F-LCD7_0348 [Faustovirus]